MTLPGFRNAPSLVYASFTPAFSIVDGSANGGFFRDGRASSLAAQAAQSFVTSFEMANSSAAEARGLELFNDPTHGNCTACHPSQRQGLSDHALFTDFSYDNIGIPRNWRIAANAAHPVSPVDGAALTYISQETNVPSDSEYAYYDLGLCGPFAPAANDPHPRPVLSATTSACGQFKVPTLRNIALTAPYFHNGVFDTLKQVIEWYVIRDINNNQGNNPNPVAAGPGGNAYLAVGTFYTAADGSVDLYEYNDLPVAFDANVNVGEVPYTPAAFAGGQAPTLTADDINAVITFLCTLTDGFDRDHPSAYALQAQCQAVSAAASQLSSAH
jgi:cytochrome c peroxidase